jgi:hypothetical protein
MVSFHRFKQLLVITAVASSTQMLSACVTQPQPTYIPSLADIMSRISDRHLKLWFAGSTQNWALANYELGAIRESVEDWAKYYPTHKKIAGPVKGIVDSFIDPFLKQMELAVQNQNKEEFTVGYDNLTAACNNCHKANNYSFNVLERPRANTFTNQSFRINSY